MDVLKFDKNYVIGSNRKRFDVLEIPLFAPDGTPIKYIGKRAFKEKTIKTLIIHDNIKKMYDDAFFLAHIDEINFVGEFKDWCSIDFKTYFTSPAHFAKRFLLNGKPISSLDVLIGCNDIHEYALDFVFRNMPNPTFSGNLKEWILIKHKGRLGIHTQDIKFTGFTKLGTIKIPDDIDKIEEYSFSGFSDVEKFIFPNKPIEVGDMAFWNCTNAKFIFPNKISSVGIQSFYKCEKLESISFNELCKEISEESFYECRNLKNVSFSDSLKVIGEKAFQYSGIVDLVLPENMKQIGRSAFSSCRSLKSVEIQNNCISFEEKVFDYCSSLEEVIFNGNITDWLNISFKENSNPLCNGASLIINGNALKGEIKFPSTIVNISPYAFDGIKNIDTIKLGSNTKKVSEGAFKNASDLKTLFIPDGIEAFGKDAFDGCDNLGLVGYLGNSSSWAQVKFENAHANPTCKSIVFCTCDYQNKETFFLRGTFDNISNYAFRGFNNVKEIVILSGVKTIGFASFSCCPNLKTIILPDTLESIKDYAFAHCVKLTSIEIPKSVKHLGKGIFYKCVSLENIVFLGDKKPEDTDGGFKNSCKAHIVYKKNA